MRMPRSSLIAVTTFSIVALSAAITVVWLITTSGESRFEPTVQLFGLLGGLTGGLAGSRAAAQERRHLALVTLMDELRVDTAILDGKEFAPSKKTPRPRVYPRLPSSATDAALTSGALAKRSDDVLLGRLHNWRDEVNGFNRRLELTEIRVFTSEIPAEVAEFERILHCSDGYLNQIRAHLRDLQDYLAENYQTKSKNYVTFDENGGPGTGSNVGDRSVEPYRADLGG
ncbi:MAG: hypothetical protein ACRDSZ_07400 [Pseudonocardiaceae bacterium]